MIHARFSFEWYLCLFTPLAFLVLSVVVEHGFGYKCFTACEDGPVEWVQAVVCFAAFVVGLRFWLRERRHYPVWAQIFFLIGVAGALFAALEEVSYGQRIFGWGTPDSWGLINDQNETNLHNASSWLDQKPRLILFIGSVIGGLIIPALRRWKPSALPASLAPVYPGSGVVVTAAIALFVYVYHYVAGAIGDHSLFLVQRASEEQEIYLYWFVFLYFWLKAREIRA